MNMGGGDEEASASSSVRSALFRLLFAGVAALAAFLFAQQRPVGADGGGGGAEGGGDLATLCAACVALGGVLVLLLQTELSAVLPSDRRCGRGGVGDGIGVDAAARRSFHPGDVFESWMFESTPQPERSGEDLAEGARASATPSGHGLAPAAPTTLMRPVFVRLEGSILSVWSCRPGGSSSSSNSSSSSSDTVGPRVARVALWTEQESSLRAAKAALTHRRRFHLFGGGVALQPDNLPRMKRWSRKHPICVRAVREEAVEAGVVHEEASEREAIPVTAPTVDQALSAALLVSALPKISTSTLTSTISRPPATSPALDPGPHSVATSISASTNLAATLPPVTESESTVGADQRGPAVDTAAEVEGDEGEAVEEARKPVQGLFLSDDSLELMDEDVEYVEERLLSRIVSEELVALVDDDDVAAPIPLSTSKPQPSPSPGTPLLLLARTSRQKEEWFWRLRRAAGEGHPLDDAELFEDYVASLGRCLGNACAGAAAGQAATSSKDDDGDDNAAYRGLNALASRVLFSVCRSERWNGLVRAYVQRRLAAVKVPAFVERPVVAGFHFRPTAVSVRRSGVPHLDAHGLWLDLDVSYRGVVRVVLTTRLNLTQQQEPTATTTTTPPEGTSSADAVGADLVDPPDGDGLPGQPEPDAAAATPTPEPPLPPPPQQQQQRGPWRIFRRLTKSRFFQSALAALSNTDIVLTTELRELDGVLVLHVPPPPSDLVWLGFRGLPALRLEVAPRVGSRTLRQALLCGLIERKLREQMERVLVLPNMTNVAVPFMGMSMGQQED